MKSLMLIIICWKICTKMITILLFWWIKIKKQLQKIIDLLESGETDTEVIQGTLDKVVLEINDLQEEFDENNSEIETVARDSIGVTVDYILKWFDISIDIEEAIREREW